MANTKSAKKQLKKLHSTIANKVYKTRENNEEVFNSGK